MFGATAGATRVAIFSLLVAGLTVSLLYVSGASMGIDMA